MLIGRTAGAQRFRSDACFAPPVGHRPDPVLHGAANPAPARPRRGPAAQPGATHDRDHPRPARPGHPRVPRAQTSRGQDQERRAAVPQALPRPRLLAATHRTTARTRAGTGNRARAPRRPGRARADHHPRTASSPSRGRPHDHRADPDDLHHLAAGRRHQNPSAARCRPASTAGRRSPLPQQQPDTTNSERPRRQTSPF